RCVYKMPKFFHLDLWKVVPVPGSPDVVTRTAQRWSFISNL
ncbi:unnamed protein product, partial [Heterotrigona itama]